MNTNTILSDKALARSVTLERLKAGETKELLRLLDKLERELAVELLRRDLTAFRQDRLTALLKQVRETIRTHYRTIRDTHQEKLEDLADLESTWTVRALNGALSQPVGVYVDIASISWTAEQLAAIASQALIDDAPSASWWSRQATDLRQRFADAVKLGLLKGETNEQIMRRIRGTKAANYTDGVMAVSRRQAERLVRSSVQTVAATARRETFAANGDIIKATMQISTLDLRTCLTGDTLVAVPDGVKPIAQFRLGDAVVGGSGVPRHVIGKTHTRTRKIAIVTLSNGETIRCTPDHRFLLASQQWVEAQDLAQGVILAEQQKT